MVRTKRYDYLDLLRMMAILLVVYIHSVDHMAELYNFDSREGAYFLHGVMRSIGRIGVPVFFMVSGALLLNKDTDFFSFYKKRMPRIIFSIILVPVIYQIYCVFILGYSWQNYFFVRALSGNPGYAYHLWFLYTTAGIYLAAPFVRLIIKSDIRKAIPIYIIISFLLGFVPRLIQSFMGITIPFVTMDFFNPYLTYFVLGYFISSVVEKFKSVKLVFIIMLFSMLMPAIILQYFDVYGNNFIIKSDMLLWHDKAFVFISASCFFMLFKLLFDGRCLNGKVMKFVRYVSSASYTIYLFHVLVIYTCKYFYVSGVVKYSVCVITVIILSIILCVLANAVLNKIPYLNKIFC